MKRIDCYVLASCALLLLLTGCARYQYVLLQPSQQPITKEGVVLAQSPVEYHMAQRDGRLALNIRNPGAEPLRLVTEKSYIVDPTGATHPLNGGAIAPNAHIGMFFPPAPTVYRSSPRFSFGLGFGHYHGYHGPYSGLGFGYEPWYYAPTDFYALSPNHWEWKQGEVRMRFVYADESGTNLFHDFTIDRQRVK